MWPGGRTGLAGESLLVVGILQRPAPGRCLCRSLASPKELHIKGSLIRASSYAPFD